MIHHTLLEQGTSQLIYFPSAFDNVEFQSLTSEIQWQQNSIRVFGKVHLEPRLTQWYGPPYSYSSIHWPEQPFSALLRSLKIRVEHYSEFGFNACLANYYRDGNDAMGWHRDNEPEIDQRVISSVTFGAERDFKIRNKKTKETLTFPLESGSLLVMRNMQTDFEHSLPRRKRISEPRVNLTFRKIN
ncbi:MAG: alkylated DNA repair dioxygenase AlkB [Flavobacteriales bacterium]|jgi:alkylated DNA repair dioxygenase AlkB